MDWWEHGQGDWLYQHLLAFSDIREPIMQKIAIMYVQFSYWMTSPYYGSEDGFAKYWRHSSGVPFLILSILMAVLVKGMATKS